MFSSMDGECVEGVSLRLFTVNSMYYGIAVAGNDKAYGPCTVSNQNK